MFSVFRRRFTFYLCFRLNLRAMAESKAEPKKPAFGNRFLTDPQNVFEHNAWDNVVWDEEQEREARKKTEDQLAHPASAEEKDKYLNEASSYWDEFYQAHENKFFKDNKYLNEASSFWDEFYQAHENKFFKDRQWLFTEFSELAPEYYLTEEELSKLNSLKINVGPDTGKEPDSCGDTNINKSVPEFEDNSVNVIDSDVRTDSSGVGKDQEKVLTDSNCDSSTVSIVQETEESHSNSLETEVPKTKQDLSCNSGTNLLQADRVNDKQISANYAGASKSYRIFEVGCGAGNTVFPILQANNDPNLMVYCCDFSQVAVDIVKENKDYDSSRCHAFVCDVSDPNSTIPIPDGSLDVIVMIFVFSAIQPDRMQFTIDRLAKLLRPGGSLLLRDYGRYDMAQLRFKKGRCLSENFYARGHGTLVYFFTQDELRDMMTKAGLLEKQNYVDRRLQVNRGRQIKMYRVWVQCKYVKPKDNEDNKL